MMKKMLLVVGLMLVCGTVFAQRSPWDKMFDRGSTPPITPPVKQQDLMPSRVAPEAEATKKKIELKWTEFVATACGEGYYYPSGSKSLEPYAAVELGCKELKEYYNSGKYYEEAKDWPLGEKITSHYVCLRGYPVPSKPCPDGFEMVGKSSFAAPKVGQPTGTYGCLKTTEPTPEECITQAPTCPTDLFHSGYLPSLSPKNDKEWEDPVFKKCHEDIRAAAYWEAWNGGKTEEFYVTFNKAVQQCAKSGVEFTFWCYANDPKNEEASPCTAKGAKSWGKSMFMGTVHGACCFYAQ